MDNQYLIFAAVSVLVAAVALIITLLLTDRVKDTEGENCSYDPNVKERSCCKKRAAIEGGSQSV
jgi:hypothetical protein